MKKNYNRNSDLVLRARNLAAEDGVNLEALPVRDLMGYLARWVRSGRMPLSSENPLAQIGSMLSMRSPIDVLRAVERAEQKSAIHLESNISNIAQQPAGKGDTPIDEDEDPPIFETPSTPIGEQLLLDQPLIFVPGIMGSQLGEKVFNEDGEVVNLDMFWPPSLITGGDFPSKVAKALDGLALPPSSVGAGVDNGNFLFPGAYEGLISGLALLGYRQNINFWIYTYDWRQSNRDSAAGLVELVERILEDHPEWADKGVDVAAHSMGCLLCAEATRRGARFNRKVLIAGPHYGAPLAFFVLNPKVKLINGFKEFVLEAAWDAVFKRPGDSENFQRRLKEIARSFPSVYELLPDDFYFNELKQDIVEYFGRSGNPRGFIKGAGITYKHTRCGLGGSANQIDNALKFKRPLSTLGGDPAKALIIYSDSRDTPDVITFMREGRPEEFRNMRDSGQNGDGTVPTRSAKDLRGAVKIEKVDGDHNSIANAERTLSLIAQHLEID